MSLSKLFYQVGLTLLGATSSSWVLGFYVNSHDFLLLATSGKLCASN